MAMVDRLRTLGFDVFATSDLKLFRYLTKWIRLDFTSLDNPIDKLVCGKPMISVNIMETAETK